MFALALLMPMVLLASSHPLPPALVSKTAVSPPRTAPSLNAPSQGVVLLHGLARRSSSMGRIEEALRKEGYAVANLEYDSRHKPIADLARELHARITDDPRLAGCGVLHAVTHSMGGIVLREMMASLGLPRLRRVVMIAPPNQGSEVVDRIAHWKAFKWLNGPAGQELGTGPDSRPNRLGALGFECGIIAGDRSINWINSAMIPGPDDGKVAVERTKVAGMKEHLVLHSTHPTLLIHAPAIEATLRFLKNGSFAPNPNPAP